MKQSKSRFTLIELLVVIVIIIILVGMLLPVISQVKKRAYAGNCRENLAQFGKSIQMYRPDYDDKMPFWLSDLNNYGVSGKVMVCPQDYSSGYDGGRPGGPEKGDKYKPEDYGADSTILYDAYSETDDTKRGEQTWKDDYWQPRSFSHKIEFCSYMYEFAAVNSPPGSFSYGGETIWWKMKYLQYTQDKMNNGKDIQPYEFPVVRCTYHWGVMWRNRDYVLNTAFDGSTFLSGGKWQEGRLD